jgi:calcium-binding protein CML|uniref:EF-hand domain-containing protein n=1 Tax=Picea sitchensis TaxID=3332 RepID=A9NZA3_PICSI|nr:unknown [Picea sitchensis]
MGCEKSLSEEQIEELKEIFSRFDLDSDGSLTQLELGGFLRSLGLKPSGDQIDALIKRVDTNNNGLIEFPELVSLIAPGVTEEVSNNQEQLIELFRSFDRDGNGYITAAELARSMAKMGHALSFRELTEMMAEADTDGDGRISFAEFTAAVTSASVDYLKAALM